ncbi:MAG: ABC transporter ATP-binding protein [Clostridia bacterium]|nr:ABC transporter ATP-binding protein [Clostridia bacterium]
METKKEKMTLKRSVKLSFGALKFIWRKYPMMVITKLVQSVFHSLTPYVNIYLSALLIGELAGGRSIKRLLTIAGIIVASEVLISLVSKAIDMWKNYHTTDIWEQYQRMYAEKFLEMDYVDVDSAELQGLWSHIRQIRNWQGEPLMRVNDTVSDIISSFTGIFGAVALTVGLFISKTSKGSLIGTYLDSPIFIVALITVMLVSTVLPPILDTKAQTYRSRYAEEAKFGNRYFMFYFHGSKLERAVDIRMYEQENIISSVADKIPSFTTTSQMAKWSRGPKGLLHVAASAVSGIFTVLVYLFVCLKAYAGAFGIGQVTQYISAVSSLSGSVKRLVGAVGSMKVNAEFIEPCFKFLDLPNNMYQGSLTVEKRRDRKYEIEFRNVSFRYPGTETYALRHVNMKFTVGERLAVVGMNGSGKTTFIKLLCRLYDPTEGEILLNGINIRKYDYAEYMNIFSVVFQDFKLFAFSLGQNVATNVEYDSERVTACLKEAGFGERLETMPNGLDTALYKHFEEDGVDVSGGEAQKIALARALYKDSPFIILDEPTAALDPIAEYEIYSKFNDIVGDKTAIYISHRLSSCRFCNRIAVFDSGSVVQTGSHDELLADENGKYHELWHAQAQYYNN